MTERSAHELARTRLCRVFGCDADAAYDGFCATHLAETRARAERVVARQAPTVQDRTPEPQLSPSRLSSRQLEVLALVADGLTNAEIAGRLVVSVETIKAHLVNILAALKAPNRAAAVAIAFREGWLE